ncbi:MAG: Ig-like domain-containing protein [Prevotella sp.]|nr:Ig-like domain-containing protein [Prevotella sp.]
MKTVKWFAICLLAVLVSAGFESCSSEDEYSSRLRELIIKDLTFEPNEEDGVMSRTSTFRNEDLTNYLAVSNASWCHVSIDATKSQMTVEVDENNSFDQRTATVTLTDVKAPEISRTFTVTQKQNNVIRVSEKEYFLKTDGGQFEIEFEHNVNDYEISCDADWVAFQLKSSTRGLSKNIIQVSVQENKSGHERKTMLYIESESTGAFEEITISQEYEIKEYFHMLKQDFTIDEKGGNISVSAQTNMTMFDIWEPDESWAKLGELEFFTELLAVTQHVSVEPFKAKAPSRSTTMYMHDETITITQYRNLYIKDYDFSILRQESKQLDVYTYDVDAVTWSSSDETVATVDANGLVKGVGVGTATITAKSSNGKYQDTVTVTIEKPEDLREHLSVDFQPYYDDNNEVATLSCTLNNDSKQKIQLIRCEIYSDLKLLSFLDYNDKSGVLEAGDSKKTSFDNLAGKGSKYGFTIVWYYTYNGENFTYRCEYTLD